LLLKKKQEDDAIRLKIENEEKEKSASDKIKIEKLMSDILSIKFPEVKSKKSKDILIRLSNYLNKVQEEIKLALSKGN